MGGHRATGAGDDLVDGPVDLAAVRADDALLDAIAGGTVREDRGADYGFGGFDDSQDDERIAAILAAWRADIEADPMPELVTVDEAVEAIEAGHEAHDRVRSRTRRRMPFAIAAAAAVIAVAGMTVAVHGAMPGDTLWGVSKVVFSDRAASVERVEEVRRNISEANAALNRNDPAEARRLLEAADVALPQIPAPEAAPLRTEREKVENSLAPSPSKSPTSPTKGKGSSTQTPDTREDAPSGNDPDSSAPQPDTPGTDGSADSPEPTSPADPEPTEPREATSPPATSTTQGLSSSPSATTGN